MHLRRSRRLRLALAFACAAATATAQEPEAWYHIGGQATFTGQELFPFHSPYAGAHSLQPQRDWEVSDTYTLYLGARALPWFEAFVDPEMALGKGVGGTLGLAGYTNGDVIRNPSLGHDPYIARAFCRATFATGDGEQAIEVVDHQIAGRQPTHRLVLTAGKLGTNDLFDLNAYANSTRTQFMNWALLNNAAYDYAADTRGYTYGAAAEWIEPDWAVRLGTFEMPRRPNGPVLSNDLAHARGDQLELELHPRLAGGEAAPMVLRALVFHNQMRAGRYRTALAAGTSPPDIDADPRSGTGKTGFGFSLEQPLADAGATGLFARLGWNDGLTETFAYTEADRSLSFGAQFAGARWSRPDDRIGVALAENWLSDAHRDYLAAGGLGFILGDGQLNYASERIVEAYYSARLCPLAWLSLDYQWIGNPGYNQDRGPVQVASIRLHVQF